MVSALTVFPFACFCDWGIKLNAIKSQNAVLAVCIHVSTSSNHYQSINQVSINYDRARLILRLQIATKIHQERKRLQSDNFRHHIKGFGGVKFFHLRIITA